MNQIKGFWDKGSKGKLVIMLGVLGVLFLCIFFIFLVLNKSVSSEAQKANSVTAQANASAPTKAESIPTHSPQATATKTNTPAPTTTTTPLPEPIVLQGSGSSSVELDKWNGPAVLKITHTGSGNFKVYNLDSNGERINLLVFTNGSYDGYLPLDFLNGQETKSFDITANGSWELQIIPLGALRIEKIPGTISGVGDDMFVMQGDGSPDQLKIDASQASQDFIVYGIDNTTETLVNEAAPYSGTVGLSNSIRVLIVKASGPWSLEVTVK